MLHKTRLPFVFAQKDPQHRLLEILCWHALGTDGRAVGRYTVTWPNFLGWVVYHIFFPMVLRARDLRYK